MHNMNLPPPRLIASLDEPFYLGPLDEKFFHASLDELYLYLPLSQRDSVQATSEANDGHGEWSSVQLPTPSSPQETVAMRDIYPYDSDNRIDMDEEPVPSCLDLLREDQDWDCAS